MLENVVIYDRRTASLRSKTFASTHVKVDMHFLEQSARFEASKSPMHLLFEFQQTFFVDPISDAASRRLLKKSVPVETRPR